MIRTVESQADIERFAQAGVDFSKKYPNGIPRFPSSEHHVFEPKFNYFLRIGGFLEAYLFEEDGRVLGRIAAMIHPEHPERGLVGLFDSIPEQRVAFALLDAAKNCLLTNRCQSMVGPVNFSIFQSYRFMTSGFEQESFVGEPRNPEYYPNLFEAYGFKVHHRWLSWELNQSEMDRFLEINRKQMDAFRALGYRFVPYNKRNSTSLMKQTFRLMMESYRVFPLFTSISEPDFLQEYDRLPTLMDPDCSTFGFTPQNELYGFCLIIRDLTKALRSMNGKTDLFAKIRFLLHARQSKMANFAQGGSLPRYIREAFVQGAKQGYPDFRVSTATIYRSIWAIRNSTKYTSVLFTLMREDGMVNLQIKDLHSNERTYAVYELPLNS